MKCGWKGIECEFAGRITTVGCKELGETEGVFVYNVCYNDQINRDFSKCKKRSYEEIKNLRKWANKRP